MMKRSDLGLKATTAICAMLLFAGSASAEGPANTVKTNMRGVYAFTEPPAGFNPLTATAKELDAWGYPPKPSPDEGKEALQKWDEAVSMRHHRVIPQLKALKGVYNRPVSGLKLTSKSVLQVNATSSNWSGYAITPAAGAQPLYKIVGDWTVPTVQQAPGSCSGGWDYSSQWVGIGGFNDQYLLQAGSAANVYCDIGNNIPEYFPWFEWLPAAETVIYENATKETLYPFAPGDYLYVAVWGTNFTSGVSTTGRVYFEDMTQHWVVSLTFTAASVGGSEVTGQSAEWIVERTQVGGSFATLPDYIADPWTLTVAADLGNVSHYPGSPGTGTAYNITMQDNNNANVSYVDIFGKDALWFYPEGSATQ